MKLDSWTFVQFNEQASRAFSTGKLHALLHFHCIASIAF